MNYVASADGGTPARKNQPIPKTAPSESQAAYAVYEDREMGIAFEYPKEWKISKQKYDDGTIVVFIRGPKESMTNTGRTILTVSKIPAVNYSATSLLDEYIKKTIQMRQHGENGRKISEQAVGVAGRAGAEVGVEYAALLPSRSISPVEVAMRQTWAAFYDNSFFYDIGYDALSVDYNKSLPAYEHLKETFRLLK